MQHKLDVIPSFWKFTRGLVSIIFITAALWTRMEPFILPLVQAYHQYGMRDAALDYLPYFYRLHIALGIDFLISISLLILALIHTSIAAKALNIYLAKLVFKLGFRAEEAGDHLLLHPRRKP